MHERQIEAFIPRQTNTGLYVQMHAAGFTYDELKITQHAYRLACRLFSGRYRKTERAFICHAVGVASSAACFDRRISIVLAAMLHAAYDSGQFRDGRIGSPSPAHRAYLVAEVGSEVEALVYRYSRFGFDLGAPERYLREGCDEADRDLLFMALAHEVDDLADLGLWFAPKYGKSIESRVEACSALADQLGQPGLAATLRAHGRLYTDADWIGDLKSHTLQGYRIVPGAMAYLRQRYSHFRGQSVKLQ
jgi:hypothetical protein